MSYEAIVELIGPGFYVPEHLRKNMCFKKLLEDLHNYPDPYGKLLSRRLAKGKLHSEKGHPKRTTNEEERTTTAKAFLREKGIPKRWMVSAAICIPDFYSEGIDFLLATPRHFTSHTHEFIRNLCKLSPEFEVLYKEKRLKGLRDTQGFIDQHGEFLSRTEAKRCVKFTEQPFYDTGDAELFSEDLYGWQCY